MACGCRAVSQDRFLWVPEGESSESDGTVLYSTEIQAKAKVMRKGGSYIPLTTRQPGGPLVAKNA